MEVAAKRYTFGLYRDCITENVINKSILFSNKHIYAICLKALGTKSKLIYNRPLSMGLRVHRTVHVRTHVCVNTILLFHSKSNFFVPWKCDD